MMRPDQRFAWVSPLPPVQSGIAQYSADLLQAIGHTWPLDVLPEPGSTWTSDRHSRRTITRVDPQESILQLGNSQFHEHAFRLAHRSGAVIVLHDVVLHHARLADAIRRNRSKEYLALMEHLYGPQGREAAEEVLRGGKIDFDRFMLSEDLIGKARAVIVHSQDARNQVLAAVPDANVHVVAMGIPLPELLDQQMARERLGLSGSGFLLSSITHVNPMKRIPVVLRAFRRLVQRMPEARFVIAGSIASGIDLKREISLLGLEGHVTLRGYVSDAEARLLARASDVCVNLRYPSTGETSASLLRLLGAGVPVIVSRHGSANEIPEGRAIHLPVDRLEEETLAEYLSWLATDEVARRAIGSAAREFVESCHSMNVAVDGYRRVILDVWGVDLPGLSGEIHEEPEALRLDGHDRVSSSEGTCVPDVPYGAIADTLARQGLTNHDGTIQRIADVLHRAGVRHRPGGEKMSESPQSLDQSLLDILACPVCKVPVQVKDDNLTCPDCGRSFRIENGIPIMLVDDNEIE